MNSNSKNTKKLLLNERGMVAGQPVDLDNPQLNRLVQLINEDIKHEFGVIKEDVKFCKNIAQNYDSRFENKFKGKGGNRYPYSSILNKDGNSLASRNLEELKSYHQIKNLDTPHVERYLDFYDLRSNGTLKDKRNRLGVYLGLNFVSTI